MELAAASEWWSVYVAHQWCEFTQFDNTLVTFYVTNRRGMSGTEEEEDEEGDEEEAEEEEEGVWFQSGQCRKIRRHY